MSTDGKAPGFWFYTADYQLDTQELSLAAQGLWMRMLCWMHENEAHRGFLELPTGEPMTIADIARRAGKPFKQIHRCITELQRCGIFNTGNRSCIYNRRMAAECEISAKRQAAAKTRLERATRNSDGRFAGGLSVNLHQQKVQQTPTVPVPVPDSLCRTVIFPTGQTSSACDAFLKIFVGEQPTGTFQQFLESVPKDAIETCLQNTALWMNTPKYQTGYGKDAVQFLKQGIWKHPPKDQLVKPNGKPPQKPIRWYEPLKPAEEKQS